MAPKAWTVAMLTASLVFAVECRSAQRTTPTSGSSSKPASSPASREARTETSPASAAEAIVQAARQQVGKTVEYDPAYVKIDYPGGDVPIAKGVCCDVVVRALRASLKMDLQKLVHEDMKEGFSKYPQRWGARGPDSNIDHRRVPNLACYFQRQGWSLPVTQKKEDYLPGDIVTCTVDGKLPHIMIVSGRKGDDGAPMVIHNIGKGAQEEPRLFEFPITGHYRIKPG